MRWVIRYWGGLSWSRWTLKEFVRKVGEVEGLRVLDAGCGSGLNSLPLAQRGAEVTLLDIAPEALSLAQGFFAEASLSVTAVEGSIFEMPFADESFDVVWNTGVIEHFSEDVRKLAVGEMLRVLKKSGCMITFNPSAAAQIYRLAKEKAEKKGTWDVGYEEPLSTLATDLPPGMSLQEERAGWWMQFHFLKYLLPRRLRIFWLGFHEFVQMFLPILNRPAGYILVSVVRKSV